MSQYSLRRSPGTGATEYSRCYTDFCGADLSGDPVGVESCRFSYAENVYRDYESEGGAAVETIPGYRRLAELGGKIYGIHSQTGEDGTRYVVVHAGTGLFRFPAADAIAPLPEQLNEGEAGCVMANSRSRSFTFGGKLYLLDGNRYRVLDPTGEVRAVADDAYIPTTYLDGEPYEQRNLLSDRFCHRYETGERYLAETQPTEGLCYTIDSDGTTCSVSGVTAEFKGGILRIPARTTIDGISYRVRSVKSFAFQDCTTLTELHIAEGVEELDGGCFYHCTSLRLAVLPDSLLRIRATVFANCTALERIYLGAGVQSMSTNCFRNCTSLTDLYFTGDETALAALDFSATQLSDTVVRHPSAVYERTSFRFPLYDPCASVDAVTLNGATVQADETTGSGFYYKTVVEEDTVREIELIFDGVPPRYGQPLVIEATGKPSCYGSVAGHSDLFSDRPDYKGSAAGAIEGCTVAAIFDGRVFLSGNPALGPVIFYCCRRADGVADPSYFGVLSYMTDGGGGQIRALMSTASALYALGSDEEGGTLYCHVGQSTGEDILPRVYPATGGNGGVGCVGDALNFLDDPVFLSARGLEAIGRQQISLERAIEHRSSNVDLRLCRENLGEAVLCVWRGYLCVAVGGHIYLADSRRVFTHRTGQMQYEWFYLCNIGSYGSRLPCFDYATELSESAAAAGLRLHPVGGEIGARRAVCTDDAGNAYIEEDGVRYAAQFRGEYAGEDYSPLCTAAVIDDRLFFGTEAGVLCCMNDDRRGLPFEAAASVAVVEQDGSITPPVVSVDDGGDEASAASGETIETGGETTDAGGETTDAGDDESDFPRENDIARGWYSFDGCRFTAMLVTAYDNCGIPHLTKTTTRHSCVARMKNMTGSRFGVETRTDRSSWHRVELLQYGDLDFSDLDFSAFSFSGESDIIVPIGEREKKWTRKQYRFRSDGAGCPFGLYELAYRYRVAGRIRGD